MPGQTPPPTPRPKTPPAPKKNCILIINRNGEWSLILKNNN